MTLVVKNVELCKPKVTAVRIPDPCTMSDADEIEIKFPSIKRREWSAKENQVFKFKYDEEVAYPGNWIVLTEDPSLQWGSSIKIMGNRDFEYKYVEVNQEVTI